MTKGKLRRARTPPGLETRGLAFWRATVMLYELNPIEFELLGDSCRLMDECDELNRLVAAGTTTLAGSTPEPWVSPAIGETAQHRLELGEKLGQLALP